MASTPDLSSIFEVASCDSVTYTKWSAPNKDHLIWYQSFGSWYRFYPIRHFFPSYFDVSFSVHVLFYNLSSCLFRLWFLYVHLPSLSLFDFVFSFVFLFSFFVLVFIFSFSIYSIWFCFSVCLFNGLFVPCSIRILFGTNSICWMNLGFGSNCL